MLTRKTGLSLSPFQRSKLPRKLKLPKIVAHTVVMVGTMVVEAGTEAETGAATIGTVDTAMAETGRSMTDCPE